MTQEKLEQRVRLSASDWVYIHTSAWKGRSPEFMQTQVNRLASRMAESIRAELQKAAELMGTVESDYGQLIRREDAVLAIRKLMD